MPDKSVKAELRRAMAGLHGRLDDLEEHLEDIQEQLDGLSPGWDVPWEPEDRIPQVSVQREGWYICGKTGRC